MKQEKKSTKKAKSKKGWLDSGRIVKWVWIIVGAPVLLLLLMILITASGAFGKLPTFEELENPRSNLATEVYSEDNVLIGTFFVQNRSYVDYSELNDSIVAALVATEDMRFYTHSGIDFVSLARVGFKTVAMGNRSQGGGSTISQQLAKNLFPRDTVRNRSLVSKASVLFVSKLKEWITAVKLEHNYTKEEIIAMYLNTVEYGSNAFGIKSAAQTFFNKLPSELTINEAALLVGVVNAPTKYSPRSNPQNATARRNLVLSRLMEVGFINRAQYDSLSALPIILDYKPITHNEGQGTYFREMIRSVMTAKKPQRSQYNSDWDFEQDMKQWDTNPIYGWCEKNRKADGTNYNIYRDGLKIYTTLNSSMQQYAEEALLERLANHIQPEMDKQIKNRGGEIFYHQKKEDIEKIVRNAMRYSDRYRNMKNQGAGEAEIEAAFNRPIEMKVFSYKGDRDTVMSPRDSIIYHKSLLRASFVAMDPHNGHIKAYVGGPNFRVFKYDMARQGKRQVGSTIKPFIYTFAIDQLGMSPWTMVPNVRITIETESGQPWSPKEASIREYDGELYPLRRGLTSSWNNFSAWIMKQAKQPAAVADFIHRLGISSYIDPVYALCLGTPDVSLYEMVGAYGTFVNAGVYTEPIFVTRIEDRPGNLISAIPPTTAAALSAQTAYTIPHMMKGVVTGGTAGRLRWEFGIDSEVGGKTGTSQENRDAWFLAIAPNIVAGAWVGGEDQSVHLLYNAEGGKLAMPIVALFLQKVYADPRLGVKKTDTFPVPKSMPDYRSVPVVSDNNHYEEDPIGDEFFD
ncbi:MAG: transglycosylase domain-containing protein [Alistipes sp.]|nr:transglycosylase domain-containing protein [Alistipes sp.]